MTQRAFARRLTATPKALPVFSLLLCAAHSHFLCTSRRAAGLLAVRAAGAAPNVVIDVRLMAINVINLNKKQYGKTTTTTLAQCKLIARNGKSTKPTADCQLRSPLLYLFCSFFGISFGFYVLPVRFVVAFWEFLFENDDRKAVTFVMCTHWQECPNGHWGTSISTF